MLPNGAFQQTPRAGLTQKKATHDATTPLATALAPLLNGVGLQVAQRRQILHELLRNALRALPRRRCHGRLLHRRRPGLDNHCGRRGLGREFLELLLVRVVALAALAACEPIPETAQRLSGTAQRRIGQHSCVSAEGRAAAASKPQPRGYCAHRARLSMPTLTSSVAKCPSPLMWLGRLPALGARPCGRGDERLHRHLNVTQRALSVTQRALSVTQRAPSVTQRALGVSASS
jgi:hypothetical protein